MEKMITGYLKILINHTFLYFYLQWAPYAPNTTAAAPDIPANLIKGFPTKTNLERGKDSIADAGFGGGGGGNELLPLNKVAFA